MYKLLKPNDWNIKSLILFISVLQGIYLTRFLFSFMNIEYPILWELIGFLSLTFIPGILLLRIFKVHCISSIETILYSTGLSLTFFMIIGLFMNIFYPLIGINEPFSEVFLITTIIVSIFTLCLLAYVIDKDFKSSEYLFNPKLFFHPFNLFLLLVITVPIFGTYLMNCYSNNILQLLTLILIGLIVLLVEVGKVPSELYPFTIFTISISLLFHKSLISNYVHGWDIQLAYVYSEAVRTNNYWDYSINGTYNSLLAFPVLSTIYSKTCDLNIHLVYKIIYSFLFSLVPVGLFHYYKSVFDIFDDKKTLFSTLIFIFYYQFNSDIADKQKIAELFFTLLLILTIAKNITPVKKSLMVIIFSFALIQSHYGLSYIITISIIFSYVMLSCISDKFQNNILINSTYIILFIVMSLSWYLYISSGASFNGLVTAINYTFNSIYSVFNNHQIEPRTGISIVSEKYNILYQLNILLFLILSFSIFIGVVQYVRELYSKKNMFIKKYNDFSFLPIFFTMLLMISFFTSGNLGADRIYQISLLILAPLSIIGYQYISDKFNRTLHILKISNSTTVNKSKFFVIFLLILFLFNFGGIYYINNVHISSNFNIDPYSEYAAYSDEEMSGALWLKNYSNFTMINDTKGICTEGVYVDYFIIPLFSEFYDGKYIHEVVNNIIPKDQYYYKRQTNNYYSNDLLLELKKLSESKNKIYSNNIEIYKY